MANDQIAIDIFVDDRKATQALDRFKNKMVQTDQEISALARRQEVASRRSSQGINNFQDFQSFKLQQARSEAIRPFAERAVTGGSREAFDLAKAKSATLEGIADLGKVAAVRAALSGRVAGTQFSSAFGQFARVAGSNVLQGGSLVASATEGGLASGKAFAAAFAPALGSIAVGAAIGIPLILLARKWSGERAEDAERQLKAEEKIAGAYGRQTKALYEQSQLIANGAKDRQTAAEDREFTRNLQNNNDLASLAREKQALLDLQKIRAVNDVAPGSGFTKEEAAKRVAELDKKIADNDVRSEDVKLKRIADQNAAFEARNESFKKNQEDAAAFAAKIAADQAAKFKESVEKAKEKLDELKKSATGAFDSLYKQQGESNPFVAIFSQADEALKTLRENIQGLPRDLQAVAIASQQAFNADKLFGTRLDSKLAASDLRSDAANFRNPAQTETPEQLLKRINDQFERATRPGGFFGFNNVATESFSDLQKADIAGRSAASDVLRRSDLGSDFLKQGTAIAAYQSFQAKTDALDAAAADVNRRLGIVDASDPQNARERAIADAKIVALTQGIDPSKLSGSDRDVAAGAREREAVRLERSEAEAVKDRAKQLGYVENISNYIDGLKQAAEKTGKTGIDITFTDKSGNATANASTAGPGDVAAEYNFTGFGFVGGSNR